MFINTIIQDFFQEHIDAIIGAGSITQFADIHARPQADMFPPIETFDLSSV